MRPTTATIERRSNADPSRRTRLSIDVDSEAIVMKMLTDLYSNPALAVIREYAPLLERVGWMGTEHLRYINAIYLYNKTNGI